MTQQTSIETEVRTTKLHPSLTDYITLRLREGLVILIVAAALYLLLSLFTYHYTDPSWSHEASSRHILNGGGRVGAWLSDLLFFLFGIWAYLLPILLAYSAWLTYKHRLQPPRTMSVKLAIIGFRGLGFLLLSLAMTGIITAYSPQLVSHLPNQSGGIMGQVIYYLLTTTFNFGGCILILIAFLLIGVTLFTGLSWLKLTEKIGQWILRGLPNLFSHSKTILDKSQTLLKETDLSIAIKKPKKLSPNSRVEPHIPFQQEETETSVKEKSAIFEKIIGLKSGRNKNNHKTKNDSETSYESFPHASSTTLPDLSLLSPKEENQQIQIDADELEQRCREVEARLAEFNIIVQVVGAYPGPVVTRFEVQLAAGTKVSKITGLAKDLARSLSVVSVRVVEVIPGKSVIGIELPNAHREMVGLQEVIASKAYAQSRSPLSLALGKDISGQPVVVDLAKMPHLLVAGTTGAGKSVGLNGMLLSLLYKATPEQLRLIMIDPKMLELSIYEGIPHLLTPVVTDMKDAASALRWCVVEMERRYRLMSTLGVRNILGYNAKVQEARAKGMPLMDPFLLPEQTPKELSELPQIVVLADEFADMMVVVGKKVETLIARLAQKARAAGIHLILATQRPSVDVITGLIKANIPTRIAFQVSSKIDSRTILDQQGAEQLLGNGDMLYLAPGTGLPVRVHGAFVSDDEVHRVVTYLKEQAKPNYIEDILEDSTITEGYANTNADPLLGDDNLESDPLYDEAVEMIAKARRVSVSSIQRRFKIGYNRAARIVEAMEIAGVVSKMEQNGTREVLIPARD